MNSQELCAKLKITAKELDAQAAAGLPRAKVAGKWVYDEKAVARWIRERASNSKPNPARGTPAPQTEIIARTVPEACRLLTQMGHPVSTRAFSQWITEDGFPGRAGRPGKQDAEFPLYAILEWRGAKKSLNGEENQGELAPRSRLANARASLAELEVEKARGKLVARDEVMTAMQRLVVTGLSTMDGLADFAASLAEGPLAIKIRDRMTEYINKLRESWADQLAQEDFQDETKEH